MYRLHGIRMRYGRKTVLAIDALSIGRGRLHTLSGPNGAGKSTLLSLLAFLAPPAEGEVYYAGRRVAWDRRSLRDLRRRVTLLHQAPYLFAGTVRDNVAFGLKARGFGGDAQRRIVAGALETVGLAGFDERKARELSGGEAQRVAMARALALSPEVLLLDEPLANIDRETAAALEAVIASLPARGTTVVIATHDPDRPARLDGESIALEDGKVRERS
ncbi:MAG: ATP-binding cassette domain-containing protein [Gemmatimonadota bacterium]